jgi:hypothetical protein
MFGLTPLALLLRASYVLAYTLATFAAGYLYKGHRDSLAEAALLATQTTAQVTTQAATSAADAIQIQSLQSALSLAQARATTIQRSIKEAANANPSTSVCRLPDGLRESINASLATDTK